MRVDPVAALEDGFDRLVTVPGAVITGLFVLAGLVELPMTQTLSAYLWERLLTIDALHAAMREHPGETTVPGNPLATDLGVSPTVAILAFAFVSIGAIRVLGIRAFATTASRSFPTETFRVGYIRAVVTVLVFDAALVGIGAVLLLGPGAAAWYGGSTVAQLALLAYVGVAAALVAAAILVFFARQAIAIDGAGPLAAVVESYRRCRPNWLQVVVLLVALVAVNVLGSLVVGILSPGGPVGAILTTIYERVAAVYGVAVATQAYLQLG